jgi:FKBP-type peptidyl-prolyl cis-trans isomerase
MRITARTVALPVPFHDLGEPLVRRLLACVTAVVLLSACAGEDKPEPRASATSRTPAPVLQTKKPVVTVPKGPPPTKLVTRDIVVGTGDYALPGKVVSMQYVGVFYKNGKQFDSSWDGGNPIQFQLGGEEVIPGWEAGVVGMRVGGRRELVIPSDLAYGEEGDPNHVIGPNEPLVFVVDLVGVGGTIAGIGNPPPTG